MKEIPAGYVEVSKGDAMSDIPDSVPLIEQLKDVPIDGHDSYPISSFYHKNIPYGQLCHDASEEIQRIKNEREAYRLLAIEALKELKLHCKDPIHEEQLKSLLIS
jgi:hypothetical protein